MIYLNNSDLVASVVSSLDRTGEVLDDLMSFLADGIWDGDGDVSTGDAVVELMAQLLEVRSLLIKRSASLAGLADLGFV